jgi:hypothetical protein
MRSSLPVRMVLAAALAFGGVATTAVLAAPAAAATAPTIAAPKLWVGYGKVTITGTATPGATVTLYESALNWNDLKPADDWEGAGGPVTATAGSTGAYRIERYVDTGFLFAVEADGLMSRTATVLVRVLPTMSLTAQSGGRVAARVSASPGQPGLPVQVQRQNADGTWTTVARGYAGSTGTYRGTLANQGTGTTKSYRAWIGGDPETGVLSNFSSVHKLRIR